MSDRLEPHVLANLEGRARSDLEEAQGRATSSRVPARMLLALVEEVRELRAEHAPVTTLPTRDLELIEVALQSAVSACSASLGGSDTQMDKLTREYQTALEHVQQMLDEP